MEFMTVKAGGRKYKVPVAYLTEGNPSAQVQSSVTLTFNSYNQPYLEITNTGEGILIWDVVSMPDWIVIDAEKVELRGIYIAPNSGYNIPLVVIPGPRSGMLTGKIILLTNDKDHSSVTVNVTADMGTPKLSLYSNVVTLPFTSASATLTFNNEGNGILSWEFENIPDWMTVTPSKGMNNPYAYKEISISCDRTMLQPGQNTAVIRLKTNDNNHPSSNITVFAYAPGSGDNIRTVEGDIMDAVFNTQTNILYYVTSAPNMFVAYDAEARKVLNEVQLSKAPVCFAISEDWTKAAVGHNGLISAIDVSGNTLLASYEVNYSVNDIAWGENDWFCFTQNGGSFSRLHWINLSDGTMYDDTNTHQVDGKSVVKKVPGQGYLIATRNATTPSGFIAYDVASKSVKSYSHMDLFNFWFSADGEYVFATNQNVYRTSASTGSNDTFNTTINPVGKINTGMQLYYGLQHVWHSNNYLWVLVKTSYSGDELTTLCQVEDNDYTLVSKIYYDLLYQADAQTTPVNLTAKYVFAKSDETELVVLTKGIGTSSWLVQFIPVGSIAP